MSDFDYSRNAPPTPTDRASARVDPYTVDIGETKPVTLQDVLAVEQINADPTRSLQHMASLMLTRTELSAPAILELSPDDFDIIIGRIARDMASKISAARVKGETGQLRRMFEDLS